jgi:hypothetical protein
MGTKAYDNALDLLTFSRASGGTSLRKISYGSELVENGEFNTDSDWFKATGWTINGGAAVGTSVSAFEALAQFPLGLVVGRVYIVTFDVTVTSGVVQMFLGTNGSGGAVRQDASSTGSYSVFGVHRDGQSDAVLFRASAAGFTGTIDNVSIKEVLFDQPDGTLTLFNHPDNIPRIDYNADGTVKGLLIEEQRTNLVQYSEDFSNAAWTKGSTATLAIDATGPDGDTSAVTLVDNNAGGTGFVGMVDSVTVATSTTYTYSIFAKADQLTWVALRGLNFTTPSNGGVWFDLSTESVGTETTGFTGQIQNVGNGWYRCSMTFTTDAADTSGSVGHYAADADNNITVDLDGTSSILIYGAQLEAGSFHTSYIPTEGIAKTRSADIASIPVTDFGYNQKAGTVVVEWKQIIGQVSYVAMLSDGTAVNRSFLRQFADGKVYYSTITNNAAQGDLLSGTITDGQNNKVSATYKYNDASVSLNGATAVGDATFAVPEGITTLSIGSYTIAGTSYLNGHIKSIQYYPRKLSDAQLVQLTS